VSHKSYFAVGDLQGCAGSFNELLGKLPPDGGLRLVGDLINRGPASLQTLRIVRALGDRAETVLGNHDIHALAAAAGVRKNGKSDTLQDILTAPDREELLTWLRHRPLALLEDNFLCIHAGVLPQWSAEQVIDLAHEVEEQLQGPNWQGFLADIFGNAADRWHDGLRGIERHRVVINALTRLRYCTAMVRRTGTPYRECHRGVRALVDARPGNAPEPDGARYRLRLGRQTDCRTARRGSGREDGDPGRVPAIL
jgi:bis(5'-nucleosyl)-tetraphosphatase (symmetrical)